MAEDTTQWSTVAGYTAAAVKGLSWVPEEDRPRIAAYLKYDEMYWNDPRQYALRVLEDEHPVYIPDARTIVDTTAYYMVKGLKLESSDKATTEYLEEFLKRETFYSRFSTAKTAGIARGDFVMHLTADPTKPEGSRISLVAVNPMNVFPIWDEDEPGKMVGCHLAMLYTLPKEADPEQKTRLRRLTYEYVEKNGKRRIQRSEGIYSIETEVGGDGAFTNKAKLIKQLLKPTLLDERIPSIPVYWFKNKAWDGEDFGSSELRGVERITEITSQIATDTAGSLSLDGLGVYATDGGRPVYQDANGQLLEGEWEISPGKVMELPTGSYFRRVDGIKSIEPALGYNKYLEEKAMLAVGLSDVARGLVEANVAQSGIALAIRFSPTQAKLESRDQAIIDRLTQLFFDWKAWVEVFERKTLSGDIVPVIGDKLPTNKTERLNELNNMFDRRIISSQFFRDEMTKLGYVFPKDIEDQIDKDLERAAAQVQATTPQTEETSDDEDETSSNDGDTLPTNGNRSNNRNRPNESSGSEAKSTRDE